MLPFLFTFLEYLVAQFDPKLFQFGQNSIYINIVKWKQWTEDSHRKQLVG